MKRRNYVIVTFLLAFMLLMQVGNVNKVYAATILPTNVTVASEGNELVGVEGSFATDVKEAIKLVNKYRLEACTKGYPDPRNSSRKLTKSDYVPIKWSSDLEYIARIRAAEASIYSSHDRPCGGSCFDIEAKNGVDSFAEVLAWGGDTIVSSVKLWYSEKFTWVKQEDGVTGHYTSMISPNSTYMGMANFQGAGAGEFTSENWVNFGYYTEKIVLDTTPLPTAKNVIQTVEVKKSDLSSLKPTVTTKITDGKKGLASLIYTYGGDIKVHYLGDVTWACNSNKITLSSDGTISPKQIGKFKVTFTYAGDKKGSITKTISVMPKKPSIKKITVKKNSAKVYIKKVSGVSGYEIRYGYYQYWSFKSKKISVSKAASSKTIKKLSRRTFYQFQIRSYKKVGKKKYYSEWSDWKSKTTK